MPDNKDSITSHDVKYREAIRDVHAHKKAKDVKII
jgi:hypothetical protein